jgi:hypothetical protein
MVINTVEIAGEQLAEAIHHREVSLTGLSERLKGVVAVAAEPVLVGEAGGRAAIMSALPEVNATTDEVRSFVDGLLKNDQIAFPDKRRGVAARRRAIAPTTTPSEPLPTHIVHTRGGKKILERVRFVCYF